MEDSGEGDVITETGLQWGCLEEIPGVLRFEYGYEALFSTVTGGLGDVLMAGVVIVGTTGGETAGI